MMTLSPAYGRDYKSKKEAEADYLAGKDFIIEDVMSKWCGKPANCRDLAGQTVQIRYNGKRSVTVVKTPSR